MSTKEQSRVNESLKKSVAASSGALLTSLFVTPLDVAKVRLQTATTTKAAKSSKSKLNMVTHCEGSKCVKRVMGQCHASLRLNAMLPMQTASPVRCMSYCCSSVAMATGRCGLGGVTSATPLNGTVHALTHIFRTEGMKGLFAGLPPTLLIAVPSTVLYYTSYDFLLHETKQYSSELATIAPLLAGSSARIVAATLVSPLELVRTRMQGLPNSANVWKTIASSVRTHGYQYLYKGLGATLARDVPFSAIYWTCYETLKTSIQKLDTTQELSSVQQSFLAGACSGGIAATITTPFDVVKTLQQVEQAGSHGKSSHNTIYMLQKIIKTQGIQGTMAGLSARLAKIVPSCAIMISSYEVGKNYLGLQD